MEKTEPHAITPSATTNGSPGETVPSASDRPLPEGGQETEFGGPTGPEPTRYGDWEKNGRCSDF